MFLTEKRSGEIKARGCADGCKQREHIAKEETAAPTISTDALFITSIILAHERGDVASADIPGAFLHATNDDKVTMCLNGLLAKMIVKIAPNLYRPFIMANANGKPILYVNLEKALYGQLKSTLLFYCKLMAEAQGYTVDHNIVYQDNMSTLSLEKNGCTSSSHRTKHIKAHFFLIKDKVSSNKVTLKYCPTKEMWADVLTKQLQGSIFRQMRSFLMNCPLDYAEI